MLAILLASCPPVLAERPMAVDDAGALERGGAKLEFGWSRDEAVRGYEGAAGFGPIDTVEVELGFGRAYVLLSEQRALEASRVSH